MFIIRRVYDDTTETSRRLLAQAQDILRKQFQLLSEAEISKLAEQLRDPLKHRFRAILFVAERREQVVGFALLLHAPDLRFCYLDFIATGADEMGQGLGGALYERVREEALRLKARGIFLECLPDDPALSPDPVIRTANAARLKFYERYGATPIINTRYETPLKAGDTDPPYLVFDNLGQNEALARRDARRVVRAILERKYGDYCPPAYIKDVVASIRDNPVRLREPRYVKTPKRQAGPRAAPRQRRIAVVINDRHQIHHIRESGYVEAPARVRVIRRELAKVDLFDDLRPRRYSEDWITAVHDPGLVDFIKRASAAVKPGQSVYPSVFPLRNKARPPREYPLRAGYYCMDTFTPINENAYRAARRAVDCTLTAADAVLDGHTAGYALVRPPGHHAEREAFGGFCYFNSAAIAANYLSRYGKVALLDVDYHHGNGSQDIFYKRSDVLTVSIHGHPRDTYPYFSGFEDETGSGDGEGFNLNIPLPEKIGGERYRQSLAQALSRISRFKPHILVVSLGLDTARNDPTGSWSLGAKDFDQNGALIGALGLPTLIVQEGGYNTRTLGVNARHFFIGLWRGLTVGPESQADGTGAP